MAQHDFVPAWLNFSTPQPAKVCVCVLYVFGCVVVIEKGIEIIIVTFLVNLCVCVCGQRVTLNT